MSATVEIVKVLRVVDTRQYEEGPDDRWIPIPGSGDENRCFRCGRSHEVHAHVKLSDDREVIVGTACSKQESTEVQAAIKSAASAAKRLNALRAKHAANTATIAKIKEVNAAVDAMPIPALTEGQELRAVGVDAGKPFKVLICGDTKIPCFSGEITNERRECVIDCWKRARAAELGCPNYPWGAGDTARRLAKLERQIAETN